MTQVEKKSRGKNMISICHIADGDKFMFDYELARREIKKLPDSDRRQCEYNIGSIEKRNLRFAFRFGALVKKDCGHWEYYQVPHEEQLDDLVGGKCTRCVCG